MPLAPDKLLTTFEVAGLAQVDSSTIRAWIDDGILTSFKTPGGHRRVRVPDLVAFMRHHQMYIPPELDGPKRVIVVSEDEKTLRAIARTFEGHPELLVEASSNVIAALIEVGARTPDAIVVDADVKGIDPFKIASSIPVAGSVKVPVILVAEAPGPTLRRRAMDLGAASLVAPAGVADEVVGILSRPRG